MKNFHFLVVNAMSHIALFFWARKHKLAKLLTQFRFIEPGHNIGFFNLVSLINPINGLEMFHSIKISSKTHDNHRTWRIENEAKTVTWYSITCAYSTTMRIFLFFSSLMCCLLIFLIILTF